MKRALIALFSILLMFGIAVPDAEAGRKRKRHRHHKHRCAPAHYHVRPHYVRPHYCAPVHRCGHCGVVYRGYHDCCHRSRSYGRVQFDGRGLDFSFGRGW